jgi:hypothetical protein
VAPGAVIGSWALMWGDLSVAPGLALALAVGNRFGPLALGLLQGAVFTVVGESTVVGTSIFKLEQV